mgnify:CR=1 FL=1
MGSSRETSRRAELAPCTPERTSTNSLRVEPFSFSMAPLIRLRVMPEGSSKSSTWTFSLVSSVADSIVVGARPWELTRLASTHACCHSRSAR